MKIVLGIASLLVVGGALAIVLVSTASSAMEYYKHVDEVAPAQAKWQGKPLEMHGFVEPGSIKKRLDREHQRMEYKFSELNCGQRIDVYYAGTVPDTFKDGAEVVVKGRLEADGFHATEVMAKCPSKYQMKADNSYCSRAKAE